MRSGPPLTRKKKTTKTMKAVEINPDDVSKIQYQLLFDEAILTEIQATGKEKKNKKYSMG